MPPMPFPRILAFVEGKMERLFINNNFNYVTVIPVSNGTSWTTAAMSRQITTLFKARNFNGDEVVVWIDREKRPETSIEISLAIRQALVANGANDNNVHILVVDRMSENIILADEQLMRIELGSADYVYESEGLNGKHRLSALLNTVGVRYKETSTGVSLLKKTRLSRCAANSASVAHLTATLGLQCWWLEVGE